MIRCSLRDDDFVSRKCTTFNVVHFFFKYRIRFLLIVQFVNDFKVCLEFITICCKMSDVRVGATDSAL